MAPALQFMSNLGSIFVIKSSKCNKSAHTTARAHTCRRASGFRKPPNNLQNICMSEVRVQISKKIKMREGVTHWNRRRQQEKKGNEACLSLPGQVRKKISFRSTKKSSLCCLFSCSFLLLLRRFEALDPYTFRFSLDFPWFLYVFENWTSVLGSLLLFTFSSCSLPCTHVSTFPSRSILATNSKQTFVVDHKLIQFLIAVRPSITQKTKTQFVSRYQSRNSTKGMGAKLVEHLVEARFMS